MHKALTIVPVLLLALVGSAVAQCELPPEFAHSAVVVAGNLQVARATRQATCVQGEAIEIEVADVVPTESLSWDELKARYRR